MTISAQRPRHFLQNAARAALFVTVSGTTALAATAQTSTEVGRFDSGKMWTFEYSPSEYFTETYGFDANADWFERARLAALRIPGCSASFVSPNGLVVTNHHCARGMIARVSREGESLLDNGFYARSMDDERPIPGYYADQLLAATDVTDEIYAAVDAAPADRRNDARQEAAAAVRERLAQEYADEGPVRVEVVPLYNGGRYSAYVIRRFTDVRLVAAAELNLGFFGGDPDNFTYPRYALDFTFYRIYDDNGEPYQPEHWFTWGDGVEEGDAVFIIGNPGPTNRLQTVAQLQYQRDVLVPQRKSYFETRLAALREANEADPVAGERLGLRNQAFSLSNSLKAYAGRLEALGDAEIMARKKAAEGELQAKLGADPQLSSEFGSLVSSVAGLQTERRAIGDEMGAFYRLGHPTYGSRTLYRASLAWTLRAAEQRGAPVDSVSAIRDALLRVANPPGSLEEDLLRLRISDLERYLGTSDPLVQQALEGRSPEGAATSLLHGSVLADAGKTRDALAGGGIPDADPVMALAQTLGSRISAFTAQERTVVGRERELAADLGRARFAVYGQSVAPDATSSPRITDGVVKSYQYNGTLAPPYTTFFGLYDRYFSHDNDVEWQLNDRWLPVPEGLDLRTPLNFISTADTYGGNSGSPAVTRDLAIVGLNFDRNIEGLSRDFIYLPERGRNIMVDVRAIREALDVVYDADRIVLEILTGTLARTEEEADRIRRGGS